MSDENDKNLVSEVLQGELSSYGLLIDKYQKPVYNLIYNMVGQEEEAKDLTQDVFIKVYEKLGNFNFKYKFFSWLYRIALNETINFLKARKQPDRLSVQHEKQVEQASGDQREEQRARLHSALRELRSDHKTLILLKYFFGLSYEEIGEVMKTEEKTVKARLFMAREKLKSVLMKNNFFDHD